MMRLVFFVLMLLAGPALAHDDHDWMRKGKYQNAQGIHCCNPNQDCKVLPADRIIVTPAGYYLKDSGETIPERDTLKSEDDNFWRCETVFKTTRCLFVVSPGY